MSRSREEERARHLVDLVVMQPIGDELALHIRDLERRGDLAGLELLQSSLMVQATRLLGHGRSLAKKLGMMADFDALWSGFTVYEWLWLRHRMVGVEAAYTEGTVASLVEKRLVHEGAVTPLGQRFLRWVTPRVVFEEGSRRYSQEFSFDWRGVVFTGRIVDPGELDGEGRRQWSVHNAEAGHIAIRVDPSYWAAPGAERFGRGVLSSPKLEPYLLYVVDQWLDQMGVQTKSVDSGDRLGGNRV